MAAEEKSAPRVSAEADFAKRLNRACDDHPRVPAYNYGRLTWVAKQLEETFGTKVSSETVRKWMRGESRPRPVKLRQLAQILCTDEGWLALGLAPDLQPREQRTRSIALAGAAQLLAAAVQLDGGAVAFPGDDDPRADHVSVYAIIRGAQYSLYAALAQDQGDKTFRFTLPAEYQDSLCIGIVKKPSLAWDFLLMEADLIEVHKVRKGGYFEVEAIRTRKGYVSGEDQWPEIRSFSHRL